MKNECPSANTIEEAANSADAILVLTEWEEYSRINWSNISLIMRSPAWVFDARSIVDAIKVKSAGLNFWRIGDGSEQN